MQGLVAAFDSTSTVIVPLIAIWAVISLYTLKSGMRCRITEYCFFFSLMLVAGFTIRTVAINECCWLQHTATLGAMVVAGALRRPAVEAPEAF